MYILDSAEMQRKIDATTALTCAFRDSYPTPKALALPREPVHDQHWDCKGFIKLPPLVVCDVAVRRFCDGRRIECQEEFAPYVLFDALLGHEGAYPPSYYLPAPFIVAVAAATQLQMWIGSARGYVLLGDHWGVSMQCYLPPDSDDRKVIAREDGSGQHHHLVWVPCSAASQRVHFARIQ